MTTERVLLDRVAESLRDADVAFALIGAAALALHGVSRSTVDIDLFVTDRRVLEADFWASLSDNVDVKVHTGDDSNPLAGVVRCRANGQRDIDVVVGKSRWQQALIARAERAPGLALAVVRAADLILLKLYAGGSQDRWDIDQLLAGPDRDALVRNVDQHLSPLPTEARELWARLLGRV